jgi:hypothetical protein
LLLSSKIGLTDMSGKVKFCGAEDGMRVLPLVERMGTLSVGCARDKLP